MKPKKPAAKKKPAVAPSQAATELGYKRSHTWDDTPENRAHLDNILERAKYHRSFSVRKLPAEAREKHTRIAKWYRDTAAEMKADFAAQKGAA